MQSVAIKQKASVTGSGNRGHRLDGVTIVASKFGMSWVRELGRKIVQPKTYSGKEPDVN